MCSWRFVCGVTFVPPHPVSSAKSDVPVGNRLRGLIENEFLKVPFIHARKKCCDHRRRYYWIVTAALLSEEIQGVPPFTVFENSSHIGGVIATPAKRMASFGKPAE
jgi:hypothetical protein